MTGSSHTMCQMLVVTLLKKLKKKSSGILPAYFSLMYFYLWSPTSKPSQTLFKVLHSTILLGLVQPNTEAKIWFLHPPGPLPQMFSPWDVRSFIFFASLLLFNQYLRPAHLLFLSMFKRSRNAWKYLLIFCTKILNSDTINKIKTFNCLKREMSSIVERVLNVDRVISFALSWLPCLRRVGVLGGLFIFKTVSRFQFYPSGGSGETHLLRKPPDRRGDLGIRGNIWIKKSNKRLRWGEKKNGYLSIFRLFNSLNGDYWKENTIYLLFVLLLPVTIIK